MSEFEAMVNAHLGAAQRKKAYLENQSKQKQDYLDPVFEFGVDEVGIVDADTVDLPNGQRLRLSAGEGRTLDSYETNPQTYIDRPEKLAAHRRSYASAFGLDPDEVTVDDLVIAGKSQKRKFQERLRDMADENGRIRYRARGTDQDNRLLAELDSNQVNLSGRQDNARYDTRFNYEQRIADAISGETGDQAFGAGDRSLKTIGKDQVVNFVGGATNMANDLVQSAGILLGANNIPGVDKTHGFIRDKVEQFKGAFNSSKQQRRERLEQERNELQSEMFNIQKEKYLKKGNSDLNASIRAGIDEFTNSVGNVIENPGAVLDKTVESLPYMLGVAAAGRKATQAAVSNLQKQVLKNTGVQKNIVRGFEKSKNPTTAGVKGTRGKFQSEKVLESTAAFHTQKFLSTPAGQRYLKRYATVTGISTVGITEGLSTSAEVYDSIVNMSEDQARNSNRYLEMREGGMTHKKAVQQLAEDAHLKTLLSVTLAAGAASAITGAGAFEGQLFTGLRTARKSVQGAAKNVEEVSKKEGQKFGTKAAIKAIGKGAYKTTTFIAPSATKEGAEELLQSGSGEFLSQLASFEATGQEVGPGVGRAAGEGFVIGAASGGLAQGTLGSLRALATTNPKKFMEAYSDYKDRDKPQPLNAVPKAKGVPAKGAASVASTPVEPGGSIEETVIQTHANPAEAFESAVTAFDSPTPTEPRVTTFLKMRQARDAANTAGTPLTTAQESFYQIVKERAESDVAAAAQTVLSKKPEDRTTEDMDVLLRAGDMKISLDTSSMNDRERKVYEGTVKLAEDLEQAATLREEQVQRVTGEGQRRTIRQVWDNKFGDVKSGANGRPGLGYYNRRMREIMARTDFTAENEELNSLISGLKNFTGSQNKYLENAREAVRRQETVGNFKYTAPSTENNGGSPALLQILEREQQQFEKIRQGLLTRYNDWKTAAQPSVTNAIPEASQAATEPTTTAPVPTAAASAPPAETARDRAVQKLTQEKAELEAQIADGTLDQNQKTVLRKSLRKVISALKKASGQRDETARNRQTKQDNKTPVNPEFAQKFADIMNNKELSDRERQIALVKLRHEFDEVGNTVLGRRIGKQVNHLADKLKTERPKFAEEIKSGGFKVTTSGIKGLVNEEGATKKSAEPTGKTLRQTAKEGSHSVLAFLQEQSSNQAFAALAGRLLEVLGDRDVQIVELSGDEILAKFGNARVKGAYLNGVIYLNRSTLNSAGKYRNTFLHEAIHAAINGHIGKGISPALKNRLYDLNLQVVHALHKSDHPTAPQMAAILSRKNGPEELLTHGITTPFLQEFLRSVQVGEQTLWDKFVKIIADLLNVPDNSALGEVLAITEAIFQEVAPTQNTAAQASANSEPVDVAPRAAAGGEREAEAVESSLKEQAIKRAKAIRLSEARRARTLLQNERLWPNQIYLSNQEDAALYTRLRQEGVSPVQVIEQVLAQIEPNPEARNVVAEPAVPVEEIEKAAVDGALLNSQENRRTVTARKLPQAVRNLMNVAEGRAQLIKKGLEVRKLGPTLADVFERRSDKVQDLLASNDFIMEILADPAAREIFYNKIGTTLEEETALNAFAQFYTAFANELDRNMQRLPESSDALGNLLEVSPLYYWQDEATGKLDRNLVAAMALEGMQWLIGTGSQSTWNSPEAIRSILGLEENTPITAQMWRAVGRGRTRTSVVQEIGHKTVAHLNIRAKAGIRPQYDQVFVAALGAQTLTTLKSMSVTTEDGGKKVEKPLIYQHGVSRAEWDAIAKNSIESTTANDDTNVLFISNSVGQIWDSQKARWVRNDITTSLRNRVDAGRKIFGRLFGSTGSVRAPQFEEPTSDDIPKKITRTGANVPKTMRERQLHDAKKAFRAETDVIDLVDKFSSPQRFLELAHAFLTDAELAQLHDLSRPGAEGRNDGLMRDLMAALEWSRQHGRRGFYLTTRQTRSGRFIYDSNVINPQSNKLHRFMFIRDGWTRHIKKRDPSTMTSTQRDQYQAMMMAIGLSMGIKTDATPVAEVTRQVEEAFIKDGDWKAAMDALLESGEKAFTEAQETAVGKVLSKEGTHTLAGLVAASKWFSAKDGDSVSISLPHETDGVTNGYIIGLLQTPPAGGITPTYRELLNAGGIYFEDDPWKNLAEYKAAGNLDNYEYIAKDTRTNLVAQYQRAKAVDAKTLKAMADDRNTHLQARSIIINQNVAYITRSGLVPNPNELYQEVPNDEFDVSIGRKWAKSPLMVMSYGAGEASIGRQVLAQALEKFYELLSKSNSDLDKMIADAPTTELKAELEATRAQVTADAMNRAYSIVNMVARANLQTKVGKVVGVDPETGRKIWGSWKQMGTNNADGVITAADIVNLAKAQFDGDIHRVSKEFILSKNAQDLFEIGIAETYSRALTNALNARLAPVKAIRARLNAANQLANLLYVTEYDNQVRAREAQGQVLTPADKQAIQQDLAMQGLAPTLGMVESEDQSDRLPMTNTGTEYLRSGTQLLGGWGVLENPRQLTDIVYGLNQQERIPAPARTLTGRMTVPVPDTNVGVSAVVKSIHALDGVVNSLVWGQGDYAVLNVHDAQVSPWWAAADVATVANAGFAETLAGYDLPQKFIDMAFPVIRSLYSEQDKRLSQEQKDGIAIKMQEANVFFKFIRQAPDNLSPVEKGRWVIMELGRQMLVDQQGSLQSKQELFRDIRYVNQFAQQDTAVNYPAGVDVSVAPEYTSTEQRAQTRELPAPTNLLTSPSEVIEQDIKFSEDFIDQLESEKVVTTWEGLAQYETSEVNPSHTTHLREVIRNLVAPALQTMDPIFQQIMEGEGVDTNTAEWEGDILRLKTAGHTLTSNVDISLQERAAQEYVAAVVEHGVAADHFVRKEARRLFELAAKTASPSMFLPETITGDPDIAYDMAEDRYNYIFRDPDSTTAYKRFLAIGLTNEHFAKALSNVANVGTEVLKSPDWSKGILSNMMSLFRMIVQRLSGTSLRYEGGTIANAIRALAQSTIAVNRRNMQRLKDVQTGADTTSRVQHVNQRLVNAINERFVDPLAKGLEAVNRKRLDPKNPTLPGFVRAATYVALKSRDTEVRDEYNRFYRELTSPYNVGKDNWFFETLAEVTPWPVENLDWLGLLRKSKYIVDKARQEVNDHTRSFINDSFDKNNYMSKAHKMAITNVILKTDLSTLLQDETKVTDINRLAELLRDPNARQAERLRLESMLRATTAKEKNPQLYFLFQNQARSLANFMVRGETTVENAMLNANNIVRQYMLHDVDRTAIKDTPALENIVDRLTSIYALEMQSLNDLRLTNDIMQHEMQRQNVGEDNGFTRLVGMHIDFKELAKQNLFDNDPVQMIKGYVYEIFDGDVNVEYVEQGSDREQELAAEGMLLVGELPKDSHDDYKGKRLLYKGMKGLNTYNKSIVSLTDLQHRGANLFSTNGFQSQNTLGNLARTRQHSYVTAKRQFKEGFTKPGANMVPVLNNAGQIVDYRYMMSESNKRKILKKEDPFDRVLPRMFASITDRNNSEVINGDVIRLAKDEWSKLHNSPSERFIKISRTSNDPAARDMWNLLPESMQREAKKVFGFEGMYVRDNVANLVLGFRKMTVVNIKNPDGKGILWGRATPVVRMAEKIWQEIVSLMRIKIAILTPTVVVGNLASNIAMLLSEGIPVNYIRKNSAEAISAMRQYQKDRQDAIELMRLIGAQRALGRNTRSLEVRLGRLEGDLNTNPVAGLVRDGLFTSITADLGVDDDTVRGSLIQKAEDALGNKGGRLGKGVAHLVKEAYMLPGAKGYQAAVAATQYGDFVARYVKFKYDTQVNKKDRNQAINEALAAFIYYDIPQPKYLQALNDNGLVMFTKFFLRIQPIVARMYTQNPVSAFSILALQKSLLPAPFNENIMNYGMGDGLTNKWNNPLNLPGKVWKTLNPTEPALLQWILNPFGL